MTLEADNTAAFCFFVRNAHGIFSVAGAPMLSAERAVLGTLCHREIQPGDPGQIDLPLLPHLAGQLAQSGFVPPYPRAG